MQRFSADRIYELFDAFDLPAATRKLIVDSFRRPARDLQPNRFRSPEDLPCPKMGIMIHVANGLERAAANSYLFDDDVLGYFDSPFDLHVKYLGRGERSTQFNWNQGFLVITQSGFYLDDWYSTGTLLSKCKSIPGRFKRDGGKVRSPPLEAAAAKLGIVYRLRTDEEIDRVAARNRGFLRTYLVDEERPSAQFMRNVTEFFKAVSFATLDELRAAVPEYDVNSFNSAIAHGEIVADLSSAFVGDSSQFMVFRDGEIREAFRATHQWSVQVGKTTAFKRADVRPGTRLVISGTAFTVVAKGNLEAMLAPDDGSPIVLKLSGMEQQIRNGNITLVESSPNEIDPLHLASPWRYATTRAVTNAIRKLELLEMWEAGNRDERVTSAYSDRTYRTLRRLKREAMQSGTDVIAAILPHWPDRGNRAGRLSADVEAIVKRKFEERFETLKGPNRWSVYGEICLELEGIGEHLSKTTFLRRVSKLTTNKTIERREGDKAAYQTSEFVWVLSHDAPPHGEFPMQYVHIDHTELEVEVVSEDTGENLGRPYLTLIVCAYSRRALGFYLSLRSPRYLCCMAAILDMIRRFGRVPEFVIFDGGAEFGARDFKFLLSFLRVGEKPRKTSACRDGSLIERMFGMSQKAFIHNLLGNTKLRRNPRQMTKSSNPSMLAKHTLLELYDGFENFLFDIYDKRRHGTLLMSPRQKFEIGLDRSGERLGRIVNMEDCIPHAFPSVRGFWRRIDCQRGIQVGYSQFRNPRVEKPMYHGLSVEVKEHPLDRSVVYAFVDREWYPMLRVGSEVDHYSDSNFSVADFEERRILHSRTMVSQKAANMEAAKEILKMERQAAEREVERRMDSPTVCAQAGDGEDEPGGADGGNSPAATTPQDSLRTQLERLRRGGFHGSRY